MDQQGGSDGWSSGPAQPPGWGGQPPGSPGWGAPPPPPNRRLRPLTLADVLDGMFRIFLANWRTFAIALGVILVPLHFVTSLLSGLAGLNVGFWEQFANPAAAQATFESGPALGPVIALGVIGVVAAVFVNPFVNGLACRIGAEAFEGANPQPRSALRSTARKYWSLIGVTILVVLAAVGIMVVPIALFIAGAVGGGGNELFGLGAFLLVLTLPALVWLVVRLSLVYPVIVVERVGPVDAMRRSYHLVKGRWWRVFGTVLLAGIVTAIVAQIASLPFTIPGDAFGAAIGVVLVTLGSVIASIITTPLTANVQTLLYFDGRIRSEGYDLEVMTRNVVGGGTTPAPPEHGNAFG